MRTIGNILWVLLGGFILAIGWFISGIILCITIIGIPLGIQCFKFAGFAVWPFGREIVYGGGIGSFFLNILWIIFFAWELALVSLICGLLWSITIVGIPFALQFFKLAKLSFMPFGSTIITK